MSLYRISCLSKVQLVLWPVSPPGYTAAERWSKTVLCPSGPSLWRSGETSVCREEDKSVWQKNSGACVNLDTALLHKSNPVLNQAYYILGLECIGYGVACVLNRNTVVVQARKTSARLYTCVHSEVTNKYDLI